MAHISVGWMVDTQERQEPPVSRRVAPYADFAGMVEKVPDRQASGEIRAVSARCVQRETQLQIVRLSPAIWLQDKGRWL